MVAGGTQWISRSSIKQTIFNFAFVVEFFKYHVFGVPLKMTNNGHCLICYSINGKTDLPFKTTTKLESQLNVIFILKHIFNLKLSQLEAYIQKWGNPEEWVKFCKNCEEDVNNLRMVYSRLQNISREFEIAKWDFTEKIRISEEEAKVKKSVKRNGSKSASGTSKILRECRSNFRKCYVQNPLPPPHPPPKNGVYDGDIAAASAALKAQEKIKIELDLEFNDGNSGIENEDWDPDLESVDKQTEVKKESETATNPQSAEVAEEMDVDQEEDTNLDFTPTPTEPEKESDGGIIWETCHMCPNRYDTKRKLKQHVWRVHLRKYLSPCPHCRHKCPTPNHLKTHLARVHGIGEHLKCEKCHVIYFTLEGFQSHGCFSNSRLKLKCKVEGCSAILNSDRELSRHIRQVHDNTASKTSNQCHYCGDYFPSRHYLTIHVKSVHEKCRLTCNYDGCSKTFFEKRSLKFHVRKVHKGEAKPFACQFCGETFAGRSSVTRHELIVHQRDQI